MQKLLLHHLLAINIAFSACSLQAENADFTHVTTMKKATETFTPQPLPVNPGFKNLTGQKFGRLTVVEYVGKNKRHESWWQCKCDCGSQTTVPRYSLTGGATKSCGCIQREIVIARNSVHNLYAAPEYSVWTHLRGRCRCPTDANFKNYGGRGIKVCSEWDSFETFLADMGPRPSPRHSIDRIDNNGDYEPSNCRWATSFEQINNRRCTLFLELNGERKLLTQWAEDTGIKYHSLLDRIKRYGWSDERALTTPVKGGSKA